LIEKKRDILKRWIFLTLETYPPDVSNFLKREKDRFANPVGYTITKGSETLFDEITHGENTAEIISALDSIIRIRVVQDFTPSQAIDFISFLKKAVREELKIGCEKLNTDIENEIIEDLAFFEAKIDKLVSVAFDVYAKCHDDINRIKMGSSSTGRTTKNQREE
jgi:hypothetical protein